MADDMTMANEIQDALERATTQLQQVKAGSMRNVLLALIDAVAEIADVLPEPHRVPKERDLPEA